MKYSRLAAALISLTTVATAQSSILLDADTPSSGSLLATQPLVTSLGTITFDGEILPSTDPEILAAGSAGDAFDILTNSEAIMTFDFDVSAITFLYGGNNGSILLEARDASGAVLDSFFQASTFSGQPAGPVTLAGAGIRSLFWTDPNLNLAIIDNMLIEAGGLGTSYCGPGPTNSTGNSGVLTAAGSAIAADNDLTLEASSLPTNSFGFFIVSQSQGFVVMPGGSQGNLCLTGSIGRYTGPGQILNTGSGGAFSLTLDLTQTPQPMGPVSVMGGETWNFQAWHRDIVGGTATSNLTDGLQIDFL